MNRRVILADDDRASLRLLQKLLIGRGYQVTPCSNGREALEEAMREPPDLIISDILMPQMDGFRLLREVRRTESLKDIPFIFYTAAYTDIQDEELALALGATKFIIKPQEPERFLSEIEEAVQEAEKAHPLPTGSGEGEEMEEEFLLRYSQVVVKKLEDKVSQLERTQHILALEREKLEAELRTNRALREEAVRKATTLEGLIKVAERLASTLDLEEVFDIITESFAGLFPHLPFLLWTVDAEGKNLILRRYRGIPDPGVDSLAIGQGLAGYTALHKRLSTSYDLPDDPRVHNREFLIRENLKGYLGLPMMFRDEVRGVLSCFNRTGEPFSWDEVEVMQALASHAAIAIENATLFMKEKELGEQLVHTTRLASMGEMAAAVAHELNNPLSGILGTAELLREALDREDPRQADISNIIELSLTCRKIIKDLLIFARKSMPEARPVAINDVVERVVSMVEKRALLQNIVIEKELCPNLPQLMADDNQLAQVFLNIINNAIDAMPEGGKLTISTRPSPMGTIEITFLDSGQGISPEALPRIFEPFFTTKVEGTGLGLSVSKGIVEAHGGSIEVHTHPGVGSSFTVILPLEGGRSGE